ncbi:MFS transporter [Winogradskyella alexanderae]|uniref:MFS transporter n=1 Tax=Winogradskyella alexanderae TaxID=2877123 RepID=A0ABS7XY44_9FLAO|nr:MFS transporter [Winogradskyella alexanderae]MCA0133721.1 MFS transporter [Winogradskyella alexanderae]
MKKLYINYIESFKGLSNEIWYIALISLVNRAGTMVIPFLSLYLTKNLDFSKDDAGWILAFFGIGSVIGGWLGGKLTDIFGFYKVMTFSLLTTGLCFIMLQYITSFWGLCIAILIIMSIADCFRPAIYVSIKAYTTTENQTRAIGLIRLAINAGMAIGPTVAGLIIVTQGYGLLFWIDGITCIIAIILFRYLVAPPKKEIAEKNTEEPILNKNFVYKDNTYWIFIGICFFMGMAFFQLIVTMPLYYEEIFDLNEFQIGLMWIINVGIIIILEMPLLNFLEKKFIPVTKHIMMACTLMCISFFILFQNFWIGILIVNMIIITFGEMLGFPFTNKFALNRAKKGIEGSYLALYAIAFSLSHIFSSKIGLSIVNEFGYQINWLVTGSYGLVGIILSYWLINRINNHL